MHKFHQSPHLRPILYYVAFIVIFYLLVFVVKFPFEVLGLLLPIGLYIIAPLVTVFYVVKSFHLNKKKTGWKVLFGYSAIPGLISGLLFAYGIYGTVHGEVSPFIILPFTVSLLIGGLVFGLAGLILGQLMK